MASIYQYRRLEIDIVAEKFSALTNPHDLVLERLLFRYKNASQYLWWHISNRNVEFS